MPKFSQRSRAKLVSCDIRLQEALRQAIRFLDFSVICGHRTKEEQDAAYVTGNSRVKWPDSKHNGLPSMAVDVAPFPKVFSETNSVAEAAEFSYLAGFIAGVAATQGTILRWGGDWDGDQDTTDQTLKDWGHLEIKEV